MKINIDNFVKKSIIFIVVYTIIINFACIIFTNLKILKYIPDLFLPFYIIYIISNANKIINDKNIKKLFIIEILLLFHCIISFLLNGNSPLYFIWGFVNEFRFFIIMLCTMITFDKNDVNRIKKIIYKLFVINFFFVLIEFFVFHYFGDSVGGIFGAVTSGGNGAMLLLLIIQSTFSINEFACKEKNFSHLSFVLISSIICAALSEIKAYYIFLIVIIFISLVLNKVNRKIILMIIISIFVFFVGIKILSTISPSSVKVLNIEKGLEYIGGTDHGYSSKNDISRVRAFSQINDYFFDDDIILKLYGFGLGNCDISSISIFNTSFGEKYDNIYHFTWFTHAMLYLETGIIGFLLFALTFAYVMFTSFLFRKKDKNNKSLYNSICIMSLLLIILMCYDSTLRSNVCYFTYICLTLPFLLNKKSLN